MPEGVTFVRAYLDADASSGAETPAMPIDSRAVAEAPGSGQKEMLNFVLRFIKF